MSLMIETISFEFFFVCIVLLFTYLYNLMVFSKSPMQCHDDNDHACNQGGSLHGRFGGL